MVERGESQETGRAGVGRGGTNWVNLEKPVGRGTLGGPGPDSQHSGCPEEGRETNNFSPSIKVTRYCPQALTVTGQLQGTKVTVLWVLP